MTGFYKDYADSSDTHQNSAEASADAAEVSATGAATSASEAATSASEAATSLAAQEDLEVTSASFDTTDGTLTLTKANSGTVTTDLDGRYLTTHQDITGKADLSGADFTGDVTITNGELTVNGSAEAELFKGDIEGAVHFKGAVASGATLTKGDVVYVSGHSGQKTEVDLADASDSNKMPAFGIVAADPVGVNVDIVTFGTLKSINTSTYTDGDELYVDTTAGGLTATAPSGEGNLVQKIAKVVKAHNSGNIKVMGAGRTNATPNLDNGNIFIGDSNNLATTASFTTEVTNATAGKADLSGATFTGQVYFNDHARVPDDKQLFFGTQGELRLSHSSSNNTSYIGESGTGSLVIYGTDLYLKDSLSGGNRYLYGNSGAETTLYFNGDEKLSTTNTGVNFTGNVTTTGTLATGGYTLSSTDGTSGQALVTDGSGNVSFDDVTVDVSGKADLSGATFTGDITAKSKLIVNKQPVASDLLTTSRSIQDLAAWSVYVITGSNYALTPEKYRDALDVNQDNLFSSADSYGIFLFVSNNYTPNELSTFQSLLNNQSNITSTFVQDVIDGDYDSLSTSAGVTIDMDASSIVAVDGNVSVDGNITVTGDISAVDDFGADSASFTGDVSLSDNGKIKLGDDDNLQIYHNPTNNTSYINNAGGNDLTVKTDGLYLKSADNTKSMLNASQSGAVNLFHDGDIKLETRDDGVRVTGNIAVDGTVDGRDVATDGTKLDGIDSGVRASYTYSSQIHGSYTNLTTTPTQLGRSFYLRNYSDNYYKRFLQFSALTSYFSNSGVNDLNIRIILTVPANSGSAVNVGDIESVTTTGIYNRDIVLSGDVTHWLSDYAGISANANGTSAFTNIVNTVYNPSTNKTTINVGVYGITPPSVGDYLYVHPFDWESASTEIYAFPKQYDARDGGTAAIQVNDTVYFGNIDRTAVCRIKAFETNSSDSINIQRIRINQTDERA